jgi:hypothetical protein
LRLVTEFRRYKVSDGAAIRDFYPLLRAAMETKAVGYLKMLINKQTQEQDDSGLLEAVGNKQTQRMKKKVKKMSAH